MQIKSNVSNGKLDFGAVVAQVKKHLPTEDCKALDNELKNRGRINKLHTEVYLLWKYSQCGIKIRKPQCKDCVLQVPNKEYHIEVYQPDTSKVGSLKDAQRKAKERVIKTGGGIIKVKDYPYSSTFDDFLEQFVSNVINNKKRKN